MAGALAQAAAAVHADVPVGLLALLVEVAGAAVQREVEGPVGQEAAAGGDEGLEVEAGGPLVEVEGDAVGDVVGDGGGDGVRAALYAIHCVLRILIPMRILRIMLGCTQIHRNTQTLRIKCVSDSGPKVRMAQRQKCVSL